MTREIPLTQGYVALVDDEDHDAVRAFKWSAAVRENTVYARRTIWVEGRSRTVLLHAALTGWPFVDHRDGNGLNNTRANLRPATRAQNGANMRRPANNTSGHKGVSWHRTNKRWHAYIYVSGRLRHLGYFATPEQAARAYDAAARDLFGEFAALNFPTAGERAA